MNIRAQKLLEREERDKQRKRVFGSEHFHGAEPEKLQFLAEAAMEFLYAILDDFEIPSYVLRLGAVRGFEGNDFSKTGQIEVLFNSVTTSGYKINASVLVPYRAGELLRPSVVKVNDKYRVFVPENFAALFAQLDTTRPYLNKNMYAPDRAIVHVPVQQVLPFTVREMVSLEPYIDNMYVQDREVPR